MEQNKLRNSVLGGFFWKFCERFLNQGVSFVTSLLLARLLMPEDYGTIALVSVFVNLAAVFINSGFATALIQKKDADDVDFSTMFYCSLICSIVIYVILFLAAEWVAIFYKMPILKSLLRVSALQIPLSVYQSIQTAYVSRHMLFRKVFFVSALNAAVSGAVGIGMALAGFGVWALLAQILTGTVVKTIAYLLVIPWHPKFKFSWESGKNMMRYGSRILAADLSGTFFSEIRSLIIGRVYSNADLAYYNKGQQVPQLLTSNLSAVLVTVMFPTLSNFSDDFQKVKAMAKRSFNILMYIMAPCMFGLAAVMEPMIIFLFTEKWIQTVPFGQILSISCLLKLLSDISIQILKAIGRSDVVLGLEVKKKPIYVALLIVGVGTNVFGMALALFVYDIYAMMVNMFQLKKYINYGLMEQFRDTLSPVVLSVVMGILVYLTPAVGNSFTTLIIKVVVGAFVYVVGSAVFKLEGFCYMKRILQEYFHSKIKRGEKNHEKN